MKGKMIVIEGPDGSGKATQAELLTKRLENEGKKVMKVSFPDYDSPSSSLIKMYLDGQFGTDPDSVNPYAASTFYAVDRYASYKTKWAEHYNTGGIIIADRYTTSNAIHQCSKLPKEMWDEYLEWLFEFEYSKIGLPTPDEVIYLYVETSISQELMMKRYGNDKKKMDIHEKSADYLKRSEAAAAYCADRLNWLTINCVENNAMRSIDDISDELFSAVLRKI